MNYLIILFSIASCAWCVFGAITGSQKISTHDYLDIAGALDQNPVFCGILGSNMDLSRITAVQGLTQSQCGTCIEISGANGNTAYVMAVDKGGAGLDLNTETFTSLFGEDTGLFQANWGPTDPSNCVGIIKGGDYSLPGLRSGGSYTSTASASHYSSSSQPTSISKPSPHAISASTPPSTCSPASSWTQCGSSGEIALCVYGAAFSLACPSGTQCQTIDNSAYCVNQ